MRLVHHPLNTGIPPNWASGWGQDEYGVFAEFTLGTPKNRHGIIQRLRWIPPGGFAMGSPENEAGRFNDEGPQQEIMFPEGFWLFETPVTQALYNAVTGENPSRFVTPDRPVEQISWQASKTFLSKLNRRITGLNLRLPSEAAWEYACRAGTTTATYAGLRGIAGERSAPVLDAIAWYEGNSAQNFDIEDDYGNSDMLEKQHSDKKAGTRRVAQKDANSWGLYDMLGNVWEWCEDIGSENHDGADPMGAPRTAWVQGAPRVIRGGSWVNSARVLRAASRYWLPPGSREDDLGLRPAQGHIVSLSRPARREGY